MNHTVNATDIESFLNGTLKRSDYGSVSDNMGRLSNGVDIYNSGSSSGHLMPSSGSVDSGRDSSGYEEFFRDSVPCPSCRGLGRIRKEDEHQLVAIIPMKDKRLKPSRTYLYVIVAVLICLLLAGLILFFMFPRSVVAYSNQPFLEPTFLYLNKTTHFGNFTISNRYNFSNSNYFAVTITGMQTSVMFDLKLLATGKNTTALKIPIRSVRSHEVAIDIILRGDVGYLVDYCSDARRWVHDIFVQFEMTANYSYLGRTEQTTLTTYQHVSCGNDTQVAKS